MKIACRSAATVLSLLVVVLIGAFPLDAQEPASSKPTAKTEAPTKRTYDPSRRVPDYFGEIGLTPDQKESIYKIRSKHIQKIEDLEKQITQAKAQMITECESLLTDTQKQLLDHRRRAATEAKKTHETSPPAGTPKK